MRVTFERLTVEISDDVLQKLLKHEQKIGQPEAGGILLGKHILEEQYYLITDITVPSKYDSAGPVSFLRNYRNAQIIIDKQWEESQGTVNYLGEWHTHPWENPTPSSTDKMLLANLITEKSNVWDYLIMIIVGRNNTMYLGACDVEHCGKITFEKILEV